MKKYSLVIACMLLAFSQAQAISYFDGNNKNSLVRKYPFWCSVANNLTETYLWSLKLNNPQYTSTSTMKEFKVGEKVHRLMEETIQRQPLLHKATLFGLLSNMYPLLKNSTYLACHSDDVISKSWSQIKRNQIGVSIFMNVWPLLFPARFAPGSKIGRVMSFLRWNQDLSPEIFAALDTIDAMNPLAVQQLSLKIIAKSITKSLVSYATIKTANKYQHPAASTLVYFIGACIASSLTGDNPWANDQAFTLYKAYNFPWIVFPGLGNDCVLRYIIADIKNDILDIEKICKRIPSHLSKDQITALLNTPCDHDGNTLLHLIYDTFDENDHKNKLKKALIEKFISMGADKNKTNKAGLLPTAIHGALKLFNLPINTTLSDIKKAYWKLAKKYHADLNKTDEDKMKNINEAFELLKKKYNEQVIIKNEPKNSDTSVKLILPKQN